MKWRDLHHHLALLSAVLWIGGMWVVGYLVVPVLFQAIPDRQLAGMVAGRLFTMVNLLGLMCAAYLLVQQWRLYRSTAWRQTVFIILSISIVLLMVNGFWLQPWMAELKAQALPLEVMQSTVASQFKRLHGISSVLYLLQSVLGAWLLMRLFTVRAGVKRTD